MTDIINSFLKENQIEIISCSKHFVYHPVRSYQKIYFYPGSASEAISPECWTDFLKSLGCHYVRQEGFDQKNLEKFTETQALLSDSQVCSVSDIPFSETCSAMIAKLYCLSVLLYVLQQLPNSNYNNGLTPIVTLYCCMIYNNCKTMAQLPLLPSIIICFTTIA